MFKDSWFDTGILRMRLKVAEDKVKSFETGQEYVKLKKQHAITCNEYLQKIKNLEYELSLAHSQTVTVRQTWSEIFDDLHRENKAENAVYERRISDLEKRIFEVERQRDTALDKARDKNRELYDVKVQLENAIDEIRGLKARLNKDYSNSSKPSSQSPNHKPIANSREKTGKKPGGQKGHSYHTRKKYTATSSKEIPCDEFLNDDKYKETGREIHKQLIGIKLILSVQDFYTKEFRNTETGTRVHASFPYGLKDDVTYDGSVKALAYLLNNECNVSVDKVHTFLKEISGGQLDLSTGAICNLSKEFSEKTVEERNDIFLKLIASDTLHADFTFGRMNGKQTSVIICCTPDAVLYQGREKKGAEGVKDSPLEHYDGILISDHEAALIKHGSSHQECMSHVKRYLISSIENEPERAWNRDLQTWLNDAFAYKAKMNSGAPPDDMELEQLESRYDEIMKKADEEYKYIPPSDYFRDGFNLIKRMTEDKEAYLLFLKDSRVDATNNISERHARKFKRKSAQVMCFRSQSGVNYYCDGLSITQSLKSQNKNLYEGVTDIFNKGRV